MHRKIAIVCVVTASMLSQPGTSEAGQSLREALIPPRAQGAPLIEAAIRPIANAIGSQVANQIPALSTSAGYTFEYNPELEVFERSAMTFGPLFTERAVTIGRGKFNINGSYSWLKFDSFNGKDLKSLKSRSEFAALPEDPNTNVYSGILNQDGYFTQLFLKLNLEAQLFDFSFTYGVLDNLDVNIDIPVLRTWARSGLTDVIPDPNCVRAGIQQCVDTLAGIDPGEDEVAVFPPNGFLRDDGFFEVPESAARDSSLGIGDIHLRAKYAFLRNPIALATLLDLGVPTGDIDDFQGTGDTTLRTMFIASKDLFSRLEMHGQVGVQFVVNDVDRSQARYAIGLTGQVFDFAALTVDFLGRSEWNPQDTIKGEGRLPEVHDGVYEQTLDELQNSTTGNGRGFFVDIDRSDILDLAVGMKLSVNERTIIFANVLVPLNEDGLRSDFSPTFGAEVSF